MRSNRLLKFILVLLLSTHCFAANWYVLKGATGTNAGTSWTNAWPELSSINMSSVACGDTIWIGGGTYGTTLSLSKNCSSGGTLLINRVLTTDTVPTSAPGWNASFASQAIITGWSGNEGINISGGTNITVDGRVGNPFGASPVTYGIAVKCTTTCTGVQDTASSTNITLKSIEIGGPPCVHTGTCTGAGASGINTTFGETGLVLNNIYDHDWGETIRAINWSNVTVTHSYICCTDNDGEQHEDIMYVNPSFSNVTFSYNTIWGSPNDGIFFDEGSATGFFFYGNVFFHSSGEYIVFKSGFTNATNIFLYNNVFESDEFTSPEGNGFDFGWIDWSGAAAGSGAMENNIFENVDSDGGSSGNPPNPDYNGTYCPSSTCGGFHDSGANSITYTANGTQFVNEPDSANPTLANFQLTSTGATTFQNGFTLSSPYNLDPNGVTRGASGHWDMGAFQFLSGTTWYIRPDGGTATQCTGTVNAAYSGSGTAQPCALSHPYWMMNSSGGWAHMVGGDTIQFVNTSGTSDTYYAGEQNGGLGFDWAGAGINTSECASPNSGASATGCILPAPPSGTSSQHTRILGQNAGSCHDSGHTHLVNPTILSGISGAFAVLDTRNTNYVDISCIEITQPDNCTNNVATGQCATNANYVRFGGLILNYTLSQGPSNLTLTDIAVVGLASNGFLGSKINKLSGDVFTASDVYIIGNGQSGWNGDSGGCGNSCETVGTMNLSHVMIDWNGCVAVNPYNMSLPDTQNSFNFCYDDATAGYGDGFVQVSAGAMTLNVDQSTFRWNTQDGFDALHMSDDPTGNPGIIITRSYGEGNEGQNFKLGGGQIETAINDISVHNCMVMQTASNFPLNPSGWNNGLGDFCRPAGRNQWAFQLNNNTVLTLENNTSIGYGTTMYDIECSQAPGETSCASAGAKVKFNNNLNLGFPDPGNSSRLPSGIFLGVGVTTAIFSGGSANNSWFNMFSSTGCPDSVISPTPTNSQCGNPLLVAQSNVNAINPNLTSSSPAISNGEFISAVTNDYAGATRPNPPAIGALELAGGSVTVVSIAEAPTSCSLAVGATCTEVCTATMSDSSTQACTSPIFTSATPAHATVNSSTGVVTGIAAGTSLVSATASGFTSNNSTVTVTAATPVTTMVFGGSVTFGGKNN